MLIHEMANSQRECDGGRATVAMSSSPSHASQERPRRSGRTFAHVASQSASPIRDLRARAACCGAPGDLPRRASFSAEGHVRDLVEISASASSSMLSNEPGFGRNFSTGPGSNRVTPWPSPRCADAMLLCGQPRRLLLAGSGRHELLSVFAFTLKFNAGGNREGKCRKLQLQL